MKGGVERDGVYLVIKGEKQREAETGSKEMAEGNKVCRIVKQQVEIKIA